MENQWELDRQNDRIVAYLPSMEKGELMEIFTRFKTESLGKLIIFSLERDSKGLSELGFQFEAEMSGFFQGKKACIFSYYGNERRSASKTASENKEVMALVQMDSKDLSNLIITNFSVELVGDTEWNDLAELFEIVFPVYPTDIYDPNYLRKAGEQNYTFIVAKNEAGKIIGAASAMESGYGSAEITDCAVHPDYRGNQVLYGIILALEKELIKKGIYHAYSITRAKSVGMNLTVKRLGYVYEGTLTNNCVISTGFEDMNVWTKKLEKEPKKEPKL
ncbi:putative beta-lysine N-acetyltransferase [Evansella vedderi]|uniref:Beta-lysine N-acetyltransferase n=1 Tax=Evansella vedderi TaxID=38282 RepID=A0ABT9ZVD2_9BACI|nr:putative beta-lysine N-acetyltransferase [Evansella vedderi]MDQ0255202.1 putative beta-lysine N-acetyltransferase [Evansella vedderi]